MLEVHKKIILVVLLAVAVVQSEDVASSLTSDAKFVLNLVIQYN